MYGFKVVKTAIGAFADSTLIRGIPDGQGKESITASMYRAVFGGFLLILFGSSLAISRVSSPGNVTFTNQNALNTGVVFDSSGTFVLQMAVSDGVLTTTRNVTVVVNPVPVILPKLSGGSASGIGGNDADLLVSLSSGTSGVSALQFDLTLPAGISTPTVTAGPAALAAGKSVTGSLVGNILHIIVFGLNQTLIGPGVIASIDLRLDPTLPTGTQTIVLSAQVGSDAAGLNVPMAGTNGLISVIANKTPVVTVGANQTITLPASASLTSSASDDGAPNPPGTLSFTWSVL